MENPTQFDLNQAVRQWRVAFSGTPAVRPSDLDELELHLRECIAELQGVGLTPEEAFWVAKNRLGPPEPLVREFEKVNVEQVWLDRVLWMIVGSLGIGAMVNLVSGLITLSTVGIYGLTKKTDMLGPASLILYFTGLIALFGFLWWSGKRRNGVVWQSGEWIKAHPTAAPVAVFIATLLFDAISIGANMLMSKAVPISVYGLLIMWRWPAAIVPQLAWPLILGWLLWHRSRKVEANVS